MAFQKAVKYQAKARIALLGGAGTGKTYTALLLAKHLVPGGRVALIDTEHESASKYADLFEFDTAVLTSFDPDNYIAAIHEAEAAGYDVLVIDSLSHAWAGKGGLLEFVDKTAKAIAAKRGSSSPNSFEAWGKATPKHNDLIEAMLSCRCHLIVTMRVKMEYIQERDDKGKTIIRKVGLQPVQRDGLEYEFDVVGDMDQDNTLVVTKTRCPKLSGAIVDKPGEKLAATLRDWLAGSPAPTKAQNPPAAQPPAEPKAEQKAPTQPPAPAAPTSPAPTPGQVASSDKAFEETGPSRGEELRREREAAAAQAAAAAERKAGAAVTQGRLPGTAREAQPEAAAAQASAAAPAAISTPPGRPMSAKKIKHALQQKAAYGKEHPNEVVVNGKFSATLGLLDHVCDGKDHRDFLMDVFDVYTSKELSPEQCWALAAWADPRKDGEGKPWYLVEWVRQEFEAVVTSPDPF